MSKNIKAAKGTAERIASHLSSGIIMDQNECKSSSLIDKMKNQFKTRLVLNQTESTFIDFKRKNFPVIAKDIYYDVFKAYKRKDKVDLMKYLSIPLYDEFKASFKDNRPLNFVLYNEIINVHLQQARIYSMVKNATNPHQTWHQLTCQFIFKDPETNQEILKYNVFERREVDSQTNGWRICHFD